MIKWSEHQFKNNLEAWTNFGLFHKDYNLYTNQPTVCLFHHLINFVLEPRMKTSSSLPKTQRGHTSTWQKRPRSSQWRNQTAILRLHIKLHRWRMVKLRTPLGAKISASIPTASPVSMRWIRLQRKQLQRRTRPRARLRTRPRRQPRQQSCTKSLFVILMEGCPKM